MAKFELHPRWPVRDDLMSSGGSRPSRGNGQRDANIATTIIQLRMERLDWSSFLAFYAR